MNRQAQNMLRHGLAIWLVSVFSIAVSANANEAATPITLSDTAVHVLHSDTIEQDFKISVALPMGYEQNPAEFPVVYIVDGDFLTPMLLPSVKMLQLSREMRPAILVGIGYDVDNTHTSGMSASLVRGLRSILAPGS